MIVSADTASVHFHFAYSREMTPFLAFQAAKGFLLVLDGAEEFVANV